MEEQCQKCGTTWSKIGHSWSEWDGRLRHCSECGGYDAFGRGPDVDCLVIGWEIPAP